MKSIAEVAQKLNISKTSIYNILKKNENALKDHLHKKQGKTFLDGEAENFLIDYYASETLETLGNIEEDEVTNTINEFQLSLKH